jgi:hypothetical protein
VRSEAVAFCSLPARIADKRDRRKPGSSLFADITAARAGRTCLHPALAGFESEGERRDRGRPSTRWGFDRSESRMTTATTPRSLAAPPGASAAWRERSARLYEELKRPSQALVRRAFRDALTDDEIEDIRP